MITSKFFQNFFTILKITFSKKKSWLELLRYNHSEDYRVYGVILLQKLNQIS